MTTQDQPNIVGDLHWRACEYCEHLLIDRDESSPHSGCAVVTGDLKLSLNIKGPELRCGSFEPRDA